MTHVMVEYHKHKNLVFNMALISRAFSDQSEEATLFGAIALLAIGAELGVTPEEIIEAKKELK